MLGLNLDTLINGHNYCSMISILNELTLQKEIANNYVNNALWTRKLKHNNKKQHTNLCQSRELNPGPFVPQSNFIWQFIVFKGVGSLCVNKLKRFFQ